LLQSIPSKPLQRDTQYQKRAKRNKFRRRAAIEPVIGHLKQILGWDKTTYMGSIHPKSMRFLAAPGWNLKKMMTKLKKQLLDRCFRIIKTFDPVVKYPW